MFGNKLVNYMSTVQLSKNKFHNTLIMTKIQDWTTFINHNELTNKHITT